MSYTGDLGTKKSAFVDSTAPTTIQDTSSPNTGSQPVASSPTNISNKYAILTVRREDTDFDPTKLSSPTFAGLALPYLVADSGNLFTIKYGSTWRPPKESAGSRSPVAPDIHYKGYKGKTIRIRSILDDVAAPPRLSGIHKFAQTSTAMALEVLTNWCNQYTGKAWRTKSYYREVLDLNVKFNDPLTSMLLVDSYVKGLNGDEKHEKIAKSRIKKVNKNHQFDTETLAALDDPMPPPPLVFRLGSITLSPCVLLRVDVKTSRYRRGTTTRADITLSLQEVPANKTMWQAPKLPDETLDIDIGTMPEPEPVPGDGIYLPMYDEEGRQLPFYANDSIGQSTAEREWGYAGGTLKRPRIESW